MPDEIKGQDQEVKEQAPSPMPSENQPTEESTIETEGSLPEGVSDRTKQEFEKLKAKNKELAEKLSSYEKPSKVPSVLDSLRPQPVTDAAPQAQVQVTPEDMGNLSHQQVDDIVKDLVDANGYVDEALLKKRLLEANEKAKAAEDRAKMAEQKAEQAVAEVSRFSQGQQVQKTHADFPEVDPDSDKFNPTLYELVRNELIGQMLEGKQDFHAATRKWVEKLGLRQPAEKQESIAAKEHINAGESTKPNTRLSHERLVQGTMDGDENAIYERLKRSGY